MTLSPQKMTVLLAFAGQVLMSSSLVKAWGVEGHQVIAIIADKQLTLDLTRFHGRYELLY